MVFQGKAVSVKMLDGGIAELCFDNADASVNKFDRATVHELGEATAAIASSDAKGVLVTSSKSVFIVGADIMEFGAMFAAPEEEMQAGFAASNGIFNAFEDLPIPSVVAINGYALGGGFEMCMVCDYRVMSSSAKVGLPETKLGIIPGFGGTVRLPRIIGVDNAVQWIATGADQRPDKALSVGAVDSVVAPEVLRESALEVLQECIDGKLDYKAVRQAKQAPLLLNDIEAMMSFMTCQAMVYQQAGKNYPAPLAAIAAMQQAAKMGRDDALKVEGAAFAKLAKTSVAEALIGIFVNDQMIGKKAKDWSKQAEPVKRAAILGAGIMGGGIAYQSASRGTPVLMKDINQAGLQTGLDEANKLLAKKVSRGRMTAAEMGDTLNRIAPTLSYDEFKEVDMVVEAVVENPKVKHAVLKDVEAIVTDDTIITSNTSTISISFLAEVLDRPENFCGMHFFNPVPLMPLVEVIRGEKSSDTAIAKAVGYATAMGKKAIVVDDCPGFLVNRVLFPWFSGFAQLVKEGADFQKVDKAVEKWGMPMGPAYLSDVVGIDTAVHAVKVMAAGFPDRMEPTFKDATHVMFENDRYGQKNGKGFYKYEPDKKGKPRKIVDEETYELLKPVVDEPKEFDKDEIAERMMIPLCTEIARCVEEGIVATPAEADMALVYGIGFPPFRGGAFRWMDSIGMKSFCEMADKYSLGKLYEPTDKQREMAANGQKYYG